MEYVIFRLLRLMNREIEMYENLYTCISNQHDNIIKGEVLDLLGNINEQDTTLDKISDIERDIKEELDELNHLLKIDCDKPTISLIIKSLDSTYPKICGYFVGMSKRIDDLLSKIDQTNSQNLSLLKNADHLWKDIIPILTTWKDVAPWWETEPVEKNVEETIYDMNYN